MNFALEALAVALYESDCRQRAGDMARRTTLSRVRAFYDFPTYAELPPRERQRWRRTAATITAEQATALVDDESWAAGEQGDEQ
jgi:hypothetical protein